jgi:hypothetical protein
MGATLEHACGYAGITYQTLRNWLTRGEAEATRLAETPKARPRQSEGEFFALFEAVKKAEGDAVMTWLLRIEAAASKSWQAAAWKLERRYPEQYGRQVQDVKHSGKIDGPPAVQVFRFPARVQTAHQWHLTYAPGPALLPHEEP